MKTYYKARYKLLRQAEEVLQQLREIPAARDHANALLDIIDREKARVWAEMKKIVLDELVEKELEGDG